mgnify:CR=1 FL=1
MDLVDQAIELAQLNFEYGTLIILLAHSIAARDGNMSERMREVAQHAERLGKVHGEFVQMVDKAFRGIRN